MFAVMVTIEAAPGAMADLLPRILENARASLGEPACRRFDVATDPSRPDEVFLYELYDDAAGFEAHHATSHYQAFSETSSAMIRAKAVRTWSVLHG
jgi:autoinducer 2-degrading protein